MAKRLFGIVTDLDNKPAALLISGLTKSETAQIAEARNEQGKVDELYAYSIGKTVNFNGITSAEIPITAGSMITAGGQSFLVDNATQTESNTAWVDFSASAQTGDTAKISTVDGKTYDSAGTDITATPATTTTTTTENS